MTDKQPEALRLADALETLDKNELTKLWKRDGDPLVVAMLRTQHAEIERLTACLKWEQNRAERIGTHGPGCEKWGPAHFECAVRAIERKDALLRQAADAMYEAQTYTGSASRSPSMTKDLQALCLAITKELSQ